MQTTRKTLTADLCALGVDAGRVLMAHASMRRTGPVEGGADAVIDALLDALGPDGTMLMVLGADEDAGPFDAATTPAEPSVGVLAEVFRRRAGVRVNDHVAARFAAHGPRAAWLLDPQPLHHYYGPGTVLERFTHANGQVLRLGANIDTVTLTHHAEYLARLPHKFHVRRDYVRADTGALQIESLDDSDGIVDWPHGDYFSQLMRDWLGQAHARTGMVGRTHAELFDAQPFVDFAVRWMQAHLAEASRRQGTDWRPSPTTMHDD